MYIPVYRSKHVGRPWIWGIEPIDVNPFVTYIMYSTSGYSYMYNYHAPLLSVTWMDTRPTFAHIPTYHIYGYTVVTLITQLLPWSHRSYHDYTIVTMVTQLLPWLHSCYHCHTVVTMVTQLLLWSHSCYHGHTVVAMVTHLYRYANMLVGTVLLYSACISIFSPYCY